MPPPPVRKVGRAPGGQPGAGRGGTRRPGTEGARAQGVQPACTLALTCPRRPLSLCPSPCEGASLNPAEPRAAQLLFPGQRPGGVCWPLAPSPAFLPCRPCPGHHSASAGWCCQPCGRGGDTPRESEKTSPSGWEPWSLGAERRRGPAPISTQGDGSPQSLRVGDGTALVWGHRPSVGTPHLRLDTGAMTPNELDVRPRNLQRDSLQPSTRACPSPAEST